MGVSTSGGWDMGLSHLQSRSSHARYAKVGHNVPFTGEKGRQGRRINSKTGRGEQGSRLEVHTPQALTERADLGRPTARCSALWRPRCGALGRSLDSLGWCPSLNDGG